MSNINDLQAVSSVADSDKAITRKNSEATDKSFTFANVKVWIKSWLVKSDVGLANVDNTSDADKALSDNSISALALKEDKTALGNLAYENYVQTDDVNTGAITEVKCTFTDQNMVVKKYADEATANTATSSDNTILGVW